MGKVPCHRWAACHCGYADRGLQEDVVERITSPSKGIDPNPESPRGEARRQENWAESWEQQVVLWAGTPGG